MTSRDDDAWRAIVENYGERAQVEDLPTDPRSEPRPESRPQPEPFAPTYDDLDRALDEQERFVPPDPGPLPRIDLPRHLPWLAVLGIPVVLLVWLLTGLAMPAWVGYAMVAGFVGSFCYLVVTMKRGGRDPWDDGAQV